MSRFITSVGRFRDRFRKPAAAAAASNLIGWDSDLADKAALLALLEYDPDFESGTTQAQAEAALTVDSGDMELDTTAAVTAGADADFKARWWFTGFVLPQMSCGIRAEKLDTGLNSTAPHGRVRLCAQHFASDVAASPSIPSDFASYTGTWIGFEVTTDNLNFRFSGALFGSPVLSLGLAFRRAQMQLNQFMEINGSSDQPLISHHAASYAASSGTQALSDAGRASGTSYAAGRRFRFALEIDPDAGADTGAGGNDVIKLKIPRLHLVTSTP